MRRQEEVRVSRDKLGVSFRHDEFEISGGYASVDVNQAVDVPVWSSQERSGLRRWEFSADMPIKC